MLAASGTVHFGNRILTLHRLLKSPLRGQVNTTFGLRSKTFVSTGLWLYLGTVANSQNAMIVWTNLRFYSLINKYKVYSSLTLLFYWGRGGEHGRGRGEEALLPGRGPRPGPVPVQAQPRPGEILWTGQHQLSFFLIPCVLWFIEVCILGDGN